MKKLLLITSIALALSGCDSDSDVPEVGNTLGSLTISGDVKVGQTLTTTVTDSNGLDNATIAYTWFANGTAISDETNGSLTLSNAFLGDEITASVSYTDDDGFNETITSESAGTVLSANAAVFSGDITGQISNNNSNGITGTVIVADSDEGQASLIEQTSVVTTYGTFSITTDGVWTYAINSGNSTVAGLVDENDTIVDNITITSFDGTTYILDITISGFTPDKIAKISDSTDNDTGELYYTFENGTTTGKLSLSILYGEDETETAYISLYDTEGSTKSLIGELALNEGAFGLRINTFNEGEEPSKSTSASSKIYYDEIDAPDFTPGQWINVEMTWDNSSTTEIGTYSVTIDDNTYGPFNSQHPTPEVLVESISVRLSSNGGLSTDAIYVNDLNLYSDTSGTNPMLEEDFESFTLGDSLTTENTSSPFGSRTFEAVVALYGSDDSEEPSDISEPGDDVTPGTAGNKIAAIVDTKTDDTGELRVKLSASDTIVKGKMTAAFNKSSSTECTTTGTTVKDAYIGLYGSSTSSYNALVDLRIDGSDYDTDYAIRKNNVDGDKTVDIADIDFSADTWTNVEITWDATNATDSVAPLVNLTLDGVSAVSGGWSSYSASLNSVVGGVQTFTFRVGDNSSTIADCEFRVDNIKIYSTDASGADTLEFEDNFESYAEGDSLHPDDAKSTKYNSSTSEAVVAVEGD